MTASLRPMTLGEILDRTFQIYRSRFLALMGVSIIPAALMLGVHLADMVWLDVHSLLNPNVQRGVIVWNMMVGLGFFNLSSLIGLPFTAAFVKQTSCATLSENCTLRGAVRFIGARWSMYLWITLLKTGTELILPEILAAGLFVGMGYAMDAAGLFNSSANLPFVILVLIPALLGFVLFLWVGACLSFAIPAAALENSKGLKALKRSWVLTRNSRGRVMATWMLVLIFAWVVTWGLETLLRWSLIYSYWHFHPRPTPHFYEAVFQVFRAVLRSLFAPLYPIALTLIYYDQRVRHEGFDIEWMMRQAGMVAEPPSLAAAAGIVETNSPTGEPA
jgi:hypothetical protein